MNNDMDINTEIPRNAISVYHQDNGMEDFPVLKAFQQYIDAEQSKARRRMLSLCIFFGILMTLVVAIFMYMLRETSARNQQLNDRLVEYAMRDRQPLVMPAATQSVSSNTASEETMRAMTDTLVALQKQIADQQRQQNNTPQTPSIIPQQPSSQSQTVVSLQQQPSLEEQELTRKTREAEEKLRKARAILDAERKKLADEREKLRQEEIERHRRRLYPEYYDRKYTDSEPQSVPTIKKQLSDNDIADILREADAHIVESDENDIDEDMEDAIEYFKDEEYEAPAEKKGTATKWHVPLD